MKRSQKASPTPSKMLCLPDNRNTRVRWPVSRRTGALSAADRHTSCGAAQPWEPQPGDDKLQRGNVYLDSQQILTLESFPPQFVLELKGNLPTPCHKLRVKVNPPDANRQIQVEVYSLADPAEICIQVLEAFQVSVPLKDLSSGTYQVSVNQQPVGELTVP